MIPKAPGDHAPCLQDFGHVLSTDRRVWVVELDIYIMGPAPAVPRSHSSARDLPESTCPLELGLVLHILPHCSQWTRLLHCNTGTSHPARHTADSLYCLATPETSNSFLADTTCGLSQIPSLFSLCIILVHKSLHRPALSGLGNF